MSFFGNVGGLRCFISNSNFVYQEPPLVSGSIPLSNFATNPQLPSNIIVSNVTASDLIIAGQAVQTDTLQAPQISNTTLTLRAQTIIATDQFGGNAVPLYPPVAPVFPTNVTFSTMTASNQVTTPNITGLANVNGHPYTPTNGLGSSNQNVGLTFNGAGFGTALDITGPVSYVLSNNPATLVVRAASATIPSITTSNLSNVITINGASYPPPAQANTGQFSSLTVSSINGAAYPLTTYSNMAVSNLTVSNVNGTPYGAGVMTLLAVYQDSGGTLNVAGGMQSFPISNLPVNWTSYDSIIIQMNVCLGGADTNNPTYGSVYIGDSNRSNQPVWPPNQSIPTTNLTTQSIYFDQGGSASPPYFPTRVGWSQWTFMLFKGQDYTPASAGLNVYVSCSSGNLWFMRGGYAPNGWAGAPLNIVIYAAKKSSSVSGVNWYPEYGYAQYTSVNGETPNWYWSMSDGQMESPPVLIDNFTGSTGDRNGQTYNVLGTIYHDISGNYY